MFLKYCLIGRQIFLVVWNCNLPVAKVTIFRVLEKVYNWSQPISA